MYISDWAIHTKGIREILAEAVKSDKIQASDIVWRGPSGDAVVASDPASLDEQYGDYTDSGQVSEYLN